MRTRSEGGCCTGGRCMSSSGSDAIWRKRWTAHARRAWSELLDWLSYLSLNLCVTSVRCVSLPLHDPPIRFTQIVEHFSCLSSSLILWIMPHSRVIACNSPLAAASLCHLAVSCAGSSIGSQTPTTFMRKVSGKWEKSIWLTTWT